MKALRIIVSLLVALPLAACSSSSPQPTTPGGVPSGIVESVNADWERDAQDLHGHNGQRYAYICPAAPPSASDNIWGTDLYTDDSGVCTAAVHAGILTKAQGGVAYIEIHPGASSYAGSTRNGITSNPYATWTGSYVFVR